MQFYGVGFLAAFMLYHLGEWFSTVVVLHLIGESCVPEGSLWELERLFGVSRHTHTHTHSFCAPTPSSTNGAL